MSTLKATTDTGQAAVIIGRLFDNVRDITPLTGGEVSQAYAFEADGKSYVLRLNHHTGYGQDSWAYGQSRRAGPGAIPVPAFIASGKQDGHYWAITERAAGTMLCDKPLEVIKGLVPELLDIFDRISAIDISGTHGYGTLDKQDDRARDAPFPTWQEYLRTYEGRGGFVDWEAVKNTETRKQHGEIVDVIEACEQTAERLMPACPEDRMLCHGDYSMTNIVATDDKITGIVDWSIIYGDPLRDIAWFDFWSRKVGFADAFLERHPETQNARERIACYQLLIAANSLGFYLHTQQPDKGYGCLPMIRDVLSCSAETTS